MRRRLFVVMSGLFGVLLLLGGIAAADSLESEYGTSTPLIYLSSDRGITALDATSGTRAFTVYDSVASGDWQRLVSAAPDGSTATRLRTVDAYDGDLAGEAVLDGTLTMRAVSYRGDVVALSPDARAVNGHQPGRASTRLVIASTDGAAPPRTYDVAANIEPEAFSTDGRALFVVQYLPPMEPNRYQVRRMDLESGELTLVRSVDGANQGQMPGIARTSVMAPDGRRLYTLYTSEDNGQRYSFVHVLDLDQQWAHCVDLPTAFGQDPEAMGIAINPLGTRVYVADVAAGKLAAVDTTQVALDTVGRMPIRGVHARPAVAAGMSRVYVAAQRNLVALGTGSRITYFHSTLESPVRGLHAIPMGDQLYVAERRAIVQLDGATGNQMSGFAADTPRLTGLGYQYQPPTGDSVKCAC
jgi:DNA-binding beta-propeller fold protein YncE